MSGGHSHLYKPTGNSVNDIRQTIRSTTASNQSVKREKFLTKKRMKVETLEAMTEKLSAEAEDEKFQVAVKKLKQKSLRDAETLTYLHRAFASNEKYAEEFTRLDGLSSLQACFRSSEPTILHAAAWCAVNLSAGNADLTGRILRISPTLIQFLRGSDPQMQELCAWALANMCAGDEVNGNVLISQGCLPPLVELISSEYHLSQKPRTKSIIFALINLARGKFTCIKYLHEYGIFPNLMQMLREMSVGEVLDLEVDWLIDCIYAGEEAYQLYKHECKVVLHSALSFLGKTILQQDSTHEHCRVVPLLHCIANLVGYHTEMAISASENRSLFPVLHHCLLRTEDSVTVCESLRTLQNLMVDPSCRALIALQPAILKTLFELCQQAEVSVARGALSVVSLMAKTSSKLDLYLIDQGIVPLLTAVLQRQGTTSQALDCLYDLSYLGQKHGRAQDNFCTLEFQQIILQALEQAKEPHIQKKAKHLLKFLEVKENR